MLPGYTEEEGVAKDSRTNTFAALKLLSRESRWQGVPFYLHSGKRLAKKETRISLQFQEPRAVGKGSGPNRLDMILQGEVRDGATVRVTEGDGALQLVALQPEPAQQAA